MDDPALFRHVGFAAQFPPVGFLKIARAIFGRLLGGCRLLCQQLGLTRFRSDPFSSCRFIWLMGVCGAGEISIAGFHPADQFRLVSAATLCQTAMLQFPLQHRFEFLMEQPQHLVRISAGL